MRFFGWNFHAVTTVDNIQENGKDKQKKKKKNKKFLIRKKKIVLHHICSTLEKGEGKAVPLCLRVVTIETVPNIKEEAI